MYENKSFAAEYPLGAFVLYVTLCFSASALSSCLLLAIVRYHTRSGASDSQDNLHCQQKPGCEVPANDVLTLYLLSAIIFTGLMTGTIFIVSYKGLFDEKNYWLVDALDRFSGISVPSSVGALCIYRCFETENALRRSTDYRGWKCYAVLAGNILYAAVFASVLASLENARVYNDSLIFPTVYSLQLGIHLTFIVIAYCTPCVVTLILYLRVLYVFRTELRRLRPRGNSFLRTLTLERRAAARRHIGYPTMLLIIYMLNFIILTQAFLHLMSTATVYCASTVPFAWCVIPVYLSFAVGSYGSYLKRVFCCCRTEE